MEFRFVSRWFEAEGFSVPCACLSVIGKYSNKFNAADFYIKYIIFLKVDMFTDCKFIVTLKRFSYAKLTQKYWFLPINWIFAPHLKNNSKCLFPWHLFHYHLLLIKQLFQIYNITCWQWEQFKSWLSTGYYHRGINSRIFETWLCNKLLPSLEETSIILIDASYRTQIFISTI